MTSRVGEFAYVQPYQAQAAQAAQQRSTVQYQALDAAHHLHPFSDMGALNRAGSRVIVKAEGMYLCGIRTATGLSTAWRASGA